MGPFLEILIFFVGVLAMIGTIVWIVRGIIAFSDAYGVEEHRKAALWLLATPVWPIAGLVILLAAVFAREGSD